MDCTGKLINVSKDFFSKKLRVTLELNEELTEALSELVHCEKLSITLKKYRKKRSLDANAYAWLLMSKMADLLNVSKEEIYELMLQRYGANETDDNGVIKFTLLAEIDVKLLHTHCAFIGKGYVGGKEFNHYRLIKGSSEYDTKEMSVFIDGIVSECKELGIETMTPADLERVKAAWQSQ